MVLAGDPMQLGPVLRSLLARDLGLQLSLLERIMASELYGRDEAKFANHGAYDPMLVAGFVALCLMWAAHLWPADFPCPSPDLWSTINFSTMGQPTRPTQASIPSGSPN